MATARVMALMLAGALGLAACGYSETDAAAGGTSTANASAKKPAPKRSDMVSAVSSSKAPAAVELRFNIPQRPLIGQPIEIQLELTPTVELDRFVARFQVPEGLELVSGAELARVDRPAPGVEISHVLTVVPKADGIFNVTAVIVSDSPAESVSRTFSIPLIAGAGFPEAPPPSNASTPSRSH